MPNVVKGVCNTRTKQRTDFLFSTRETGCGQPKSVFLLGGGEKSICAYGKSRKAHICFL